MVSERKATPWALTSVGLLLIVGVAAIPHQAALSSAYVNSETILLQTPGYAQAESTFTAGMESFQAEVEQLQRTFDSAVAAFDQQSPMLSQAARQERMEELRQMQQQAETRSQELTQRAQQRRAELVAPLEDRIQSVIDGLRAERRIGLIFDVAAPGNNIISADPTLDLTALVVQRLNSGGP